MEAIRILELTKKYKNIVAVDNLSLDIQKGELFSLLGINGAGKTTTIKMLSCLSTPTSGDAIILGHSVTKEKSAVKSLIAVSPQETAVASGMTVRENLELICGIYLFSKEKTKEKIDELSSLLGLFDGMDRRASKLSGGYARRLRRNYPWSQRNEREERGEIPHCGVAPGNCGCIGYDSP